MPPLVLFKIPISCVQLRLLSHLRVVHTCVYARKSLNLPKFYFTTKYLSKYTLNDTEN